MQRTNLNVAPYFDDFDESKHFQKILFRPRSVQARELNQMQTILANQIEKFGQHIFQEGAVVIPGGIRVFNDVDSLSIVFDGGSVFTDIANTDNIQIISKTSNLTANISKKMDAAGADPATLFVDYVNSGSNQEKTFAVNEACGIYVTDDNGVQTNLANVTVTATNKGSWAKIQEGVYFVRGMFIEVDTQDSVINKYDAMHDMKIGFKVNEIIVDETIDSSLLSNATGYPNVKAPGAARLQITLTLTAKEITDDTDKDFVEINRYINGNLQNAVDLTQYAILDRTLAKRTYEEAGNYVVNNFAIEIKEHLNQNNNGGVYTADQGGDSSKFIAAFKPGIGYVQGYRIETNSVDYLTIDKARDTAFYNNSVTSAQLGQYIIVQNMFSLPDVDIKKVVNLTDSTNAIVGTTRIRAVRGEGTTTYRIYIFDTNYNAGKSINNVAHIAYTDAANNFKADLTQSVLFDSTLNTSIFSLPMSGVKSLKSSGASDTTYTVLRSYVITTNSSGIASISAGVNEIFDSITSQDYLIAVTGAANAGTLYSSTGTVTLTGSPVGSGIQINLGAGNGNKTIKVIAPIVKTGAIEKTKTLSTINNEAVNFNNTNSMQLAHADVYSITSVIDTATMLDITNLFTFDNGQRNNFYQNGILKTIDGSQITKNLLVTYQYFYHSAGDYFSIDSYGSLDRTLIPNYTSTSGVTYTLADCLDFRPLKDVSGNFTSTTFQGDVIKPMNSIRADLYYYLNRVDTLYLDADGNFGYARGIPGVNQPPSNIPAGVMALYDIYLPPYTPDVSKITITTYDNRRYTMRDIGNLDKRITNIEYYTALNELETKVNSTQVIDPVTGNSRFKNGIATDSFVDFSLGDLSSSDWGAAIDPNGNGLSPSIYPNVADMDGTGPGVGDVFMKSYTEVATVTQPYATRTININPYAVYTWSGSVKLTPSSDSWKDTKWLAPIYR